MSKRKSDHLHEAYATHKGRLQQELVARSGVARFKASNDQQQLRMTLYMSK
jgi:hypothetical protein